MTKLETFESEKDIQKDRRIKAFSIISIVISILFVLVGSASLFYAFYVSLTSAEGWDNLLGDVCIIIFLAIDLVVIYLGFKGLKDGSIILRTLTYKGDFEEKTPSLVCRILSIVFFFLFGFAGIYFLILLLNPSLSLFGQNFFTSMKIILVDVGLYVMLYSVLFFAFPLVYEKVRQEKRGIAL